jgi:hypothetical protein
MNRANSLSLPDTSDALDTGEFRGPNWTPPLTKLRVYEAIYDLNRTFEAAVLAVDRLARLEFFESETEKEWLAILKTRVDYLRASTNSLLVENLQEYEQGEAARLEGITHDWDKARADTNNVFFAARDRREEIKQQIEELQEALTFDHKQPSRPKGRSAKRRPKTAKKTAKKHPT